MARGDVAAFGEMAGEFLAETAAESAAWERSWVGGEHARVALEIHRSKGGASLFGFERLQGMLGAMERGLLAGGLDFDPARMREELGKAVAALAALLESR